MGFRPGPVTWPTGCTELRIPGTSFVLKKQGCQPYIGCGRQGFVYFAYSTDTVYQDRYFAIKFPTEYFNPEEAKFGNGLRSDYISPLEAVIQIPTWPHAPRCYVMTYHRSTLEELIFECFERSIVIPENVLWHWSSHIAQGLRYLHHADKPCSSGGNVQRALVHRDLKPANIMISYDRRLFEANPTSALMKSRAVIIDLGTVGIAGQNSHVVVQREEDDRYKSPDYYPHSSVDLQPQLCHPEMDIHAFGAILQDLNAVREGRNPYANA